MSNDILNGEPNIIIITINDDWGLGLDLHIDQCRGGLDPRVAGHPGHLTLELGVILEADLGDFEAEVSLRAASPHAVAGELREPPLCAQSELARPRVPRPLRINRLILPTHPFPCNQNQTK